MPDPFLTEEHQLIRSSVKEFAERYIAPIARKMDLEDYYPRDLIKELAKQGFLTPSAPPEYGGPGIDLRGSVVVVEELSRYSPTLGFITEIVNDNIVYALLKYGNNRQKEEILPKIASGEWVASYALTEPCCGTDAAAIETRAERRGGEWVINGRKIWITQGAYADIYLLFARTGPKDARHKAITAFLVKRSACIEVSKLEMMGMRGAGEAEVKFNDCVVSDDDVVGKVNEGFKIAMVTLDLARIGISGVAVGLSQGVLDEALEWAKTRTAFGKPLIDWEWIQFQLADMKTKLEIGRTITYKAAWLYDNKDPSFVLYSSIAKLYTAQMAVEIARDGVQILGGFGYSKESFSERAYRDAKVLEIAEGTNEAQRIVIHRILTRGLPEVEL
ncbi:acyl-CoA dehydrogenase family protein [Vulcanisaeta sp. JCM 14467]|uniref:acyl-CoA dehydrogenase family protein n=1 Tax=Vulcanisaeta sp. JCM 14467 TaxID=1295370 RepID=UPI0006D1F32A|nr:acyl-CoA dehydrogenase family protein [Vulcanisaeta sp. JCM 14467]